MTQYQSYSGQDEEKKNPLANLAAQYGVKYGINSLMGNGTAASQLVAGNTVYDAATGIPVASAAPAAQSAFSLSGIGGAGNAILPAAGLAGAYDLFTHDRGHLASTAEGAASGAALGSWAGPPGALIGGGIGGLVGLGKSFMGGGPSTKEVEAQRWGDLQKQGIAGAAEAYQANHGSAGDGYWHDGQFAGKKWNFNDALTLAKQDPGQFNEVEGNYSTFDNDWHGYSVDQKKAIVKSLIDNDQYYSDKGDVLIKDKTKALSLRDQALGSMPKSGGTPRADTPVKPKPRGGGGSGGTGFNLQPNPPPIMPEPDDQTMTPGAQSYQDMLQKLLAAQRLTQG